jgi:DNA-binding MarR family transcriptional regulator
VLRDGLVRLLQIYADESERLSQVFAERNGMHPTDLQALLAIVQADAGGAPLTPGRLGEHLGVSSGATTAVVDRLERAEHVRRVRDARDRRCVTLHYGTAASAVEGAFLGPLALKIDRVVAGFDAAELTAVRRFLELANAAMREYRAEVTTDGRGPAGAVAAAGPGATVAGIRV